MNFDSLSSMRRSGFQGFVPIRKLRLSECSTVPFSKAIYLILRVNLKCASFLSVSAGGQFKQRNPTVSITLLQDKWVDNALVLYIGKAGRSLRRRIGTYVRFGQGAPVAHWAEDSFGNSAIPAISWFAGRLHLALFREIWRKS